MKDQCYGSKSLIPSRPTGVQALPTESRGGFRPNGNRFGESFGSDVASHSGQDGGDILHHRASTLIQGLQGVVNGHPESQLFGAINRHPDRRVLDRWCWIWFRCRIYTENRNDINQGMLHPGRLTWNLTIDLWIIIFSTTQFNFARAQQYIMVPSL